MVSFFALHDYNEEMKGFGAIELGLDALENYNNEGFGIYWTLNEFEGARKKENLTRITHWFCDIDGGNKPEQMKKINSLLMPPSFIVETKNGYHCYWAVESNATIENFERIERGIAEKLDADIHAIDVLRLLRVPGFLHQKNPNEPFEVTLLDYAGSDRFYTEAQMLAYFGKKKEPVRFKKPLNSDKNDFLNEDNWERLFKTSQLYKGCRNSKLAQFTFWLRDEGLNAEEIRYVINGINGKMVTPLSQREVDSILRGKI